MNSINIELNNVCRICLEIKTETLPLFSFEDEENFLLEKITLCFHINLSFDISLPKVICNKCVYDLETAYNFRNKCITFNERFSVVCAKKDLSTLYYPNDEELNKINRNCNLFEMKQEENASLNSPNVMKTIIQNENRIHQCYICHKKLRSEDSLLKHNLSMHTKRNYIGTVTGTGTKRRHHCTKCSYSTPHSQTLANHLRRHNGDRPYHCECGKRFTQSSSLAAHRKTHSNTMLFICTTCGKQFKHAFTLKKHQYVHESGKFSCDICKKSLKTKQSLQNHIQRHYNICNYSCEDCGKTFVTSSELSNHRIKHSLIKKVECHLCGYKTRTRKCLLIHLKRHAGDKSYKCETCLISFYTSGDLKRHQRVHTRDKPYGCPTCGQRFTHSPSLNRHMVTVHGVIYKWADFKWKDQKKNDNENTDIKKK